MQQSANTYPEPGGGRGYRGGGAGGPQQQQWGGGSVQQPRGAARDDTFVDTRRRNQSSSGGPATGFNGTLCVSSGTRLSEFDSFSIAFASKEYRILSLQREETSDGEADEAVAEEAAGLVTSSSSRTTSRSNSTRSRTASARATEDVGRPSRLADDRTSHADEASRALAWSRNRMNMQVLAADRAVLRCP